MGLLTKDWVVRIFLAKRLSPAHTSSQKKPVSLGIRLVIIPLTSYLLLILSCFLPSPPASNIQEGPRPPPGFSACFPPTCPPRPSSLGFSTRNAADSRRWHYQFQTSKIRNREAASTNHLVKGGIPSSIRCRASSTISSNPCFLPLRRP